MSSWIVPVVRGHKLLSALLLLWLPTLAAGLLIFPSAGPSWKHLAPHRTISVRSVEWCGEGNMLPLQRYHSKESNDPPPFQIRTNEHDGEDDQTMIGSILEDPSAFNLSKTSKSLLEDYPSMSSEQQTRFLQKIRVEHRATQPVPPDALQVLYCDAHICVTNKPSGVLSAPGSRRNPSLANVVYDTLLQPQPSSSSPTATTLDLDQMIVHRLDMTTSGILVYALSLPALQQLHADFSNRRVQKTYEALVQGHMPQDHPVEGEIDVDLERDPNNPPFMRMAQPKTPITMNDDDDEEDVTTSLNKFYNQAPKESVTTWSLLGREFRNGKPVSRLELRPWTGRTHQLRVHCAQALGAPIVGDDIYGDGETETKGSPRLCLHAKTLCIYHPISGAPMIFDADPPF